MRSRKAKSKAIMYRGFLHLNRPLLECQDFISLKGNSIKLLIDLGYQYNGYNNGDLCASLSVMRKRGWNSNQQLAKALKELLERNLIVQTKQGGLNLGPNLYAITWQPINECNGKLDANPTTVAPRSFR
tara:strand:- start:11 stop:397 length:387 start_codon:yes stop_codon:yes gene_type:complete